MTLSSNKLRRLSGGLLALLCSELALGWALLRDPRPVLVESAESRTVRDGPVFNRVRFIPGRDQDLWLMQQSHSGLSPAFESWDRLAIAVDKTTTPKTARFYQLEPGPLERPESWKPLPYRAACFQCHPNGPRALRPLSLSVEASLGAWDRARIALLNLRIKTYLRVESLAGQDPPIGKTPFRFPGVAANERLEVETCLRCHNDSRWGRGRLTRQNFGSIQFLVQRGEMPPPGFGLAAEERAAVERFVSEL